MENKLKIIETDQYVLVVSDEEIKLKDWYVHNQSPKGLRVWQDNTQFIPMDAKKIIAYQPKNNAPELDLTLLPEMNVEDDVNLKAQYYAVSTKSPNREAHRRGYVEGYKAATKVYSEEDIIKLMYLAWNAGFKKYDVVEAGLEGKETDSEVRWILSKFKSSKTPKWFVAEIETEYKPKQNIKDIPYEDIPKTTTINNKTYLVGTYKYE